jgi:hypothetical protein
MKKLIIPIVLGSLAWATLADAAPSDRAAAKRRVLEDQITRQLYILNVNQANKYQTDMTFTTPVVMQAYRELLLWARHLPADSAQRTELMKLLRDGLTAAVWHSGMGLPIENWTGTGQPVSILFVRGHTHYVELPDFARPATLKWDAKHFDPRITPDSIGFSLAVKSLYVRTAGSDKELGEVLRVSALREFEAALPLLELGGGKERGFMPIAVKKGTQWETAIDGSLVSGQVVLLLGMAQLHEMLAGLENDEAVAGRRPSEWRKEVRRVMERHYHATVANHFDAKAKSFVSEYSPKKEASGRLGSEDAGLVLEALASLAESLPAGDGLRESVVKQLQAQAAFVAAALEGKELAPKGFLVRQGGSETSPLFRLGDQLALVNGLLAAAKATGNTDWSKTANELFAATRKSFWAEQAGMFRTVPNHLVAAYDGRLLGLSLAAWRRLDAGAADSAEKRHGNHLIDKVVKQAGLQWAESPLAGEARQPEDFVKEDLPRLIDEILPLENEEKAKRIAAAVKAFSDQNGNGVPGCRFSGGRFGSAPVLITQATINLPADPPPEKEAAMPDPAPATRSPQ